MSIGTILLIAAGLLILFGAGQRVLDRLRLTDRQALLFIALRLTGVIAWSWLWVLAPLWLPLTILIIAAFFAVAVS